MTELRALSLPLRDVLDELAADAPSARRPRRMAWVAWTAAAAAVEIFNPGLDAGENGGNRDAFVAPASPRAMAAETMIAGG